MELKDRIKKIRTDAGDSQEKFASKIKASRSAVCKLESGENNPSEQTIALICSSYKVNYQWIVNGVGEMYAEDDSDAQAVVDSVMTGDNEFAKSVLVKFARLSEDHWRQLKEIMEAMMQE